MSCSIFQPNLLTERELCASDSLSLQLVTVSQECFQPYACFSANLRENWPSPNAMQHEVQRSKFDTASNWLTYDVLRIQAKVNFKTWLAESEKSVP